MHEMNLDYIKEKVRASRIEAAELQKREIRCPHCGRLVLTVCSDANGHLQFQCTKCLRHTMINLAYFRKQKLQERRFLQLK